MKSYNKILDDMISNMPQQLNVAPGSVLNTLLEAVAISDYEAQQPYQVLLDRIEAQDRLIAKLQEDFTNYILLEKKDK